MFTPENTSGGAIAAFEKELYELIKDSADETYYKRMLAVQNQGFLQCRQHFGEISSQISDNNRYVLYLILDSLRSTKNIDLHFSNWYGSSQGPAGYKQYHFPQVSRQGK